MTQYPLNRLVRNLLVLALGCVLGVPATHAELSPEAQSAMKKGVLAGQQQDFPLALRYFAEAHRLVPDAPEIYFNLGLTESKIPGRELRAMAWFGAYLAANPAAPNAAAIRDQIEVLEVKSAGNTARLLKLAEDAAGKLPDNDNYDGRWQQLTYVARNHIEIGDVAAAQKIVTLLKRHPEHQQTVLAWIMWAQANQGDPAGARKTLTSIRPGEADYNALEEVAEALTKLGDREAALKMLALAAKKVGEMSNAETGSGIQAPWGRRGEQLGLMVEQQVKAGDPAGAEKTLKQLESKARSDIYRTVCSAWVALGYARSGDKAMAKKYIAATRSLISTIFTKKDMNENEPWQLVEILPNLAEAQALAGEHAEAVATLAEARKFSKHTKAGDWLTYWYPLNIARTQFRIGDVADAQQTMKEVQAMVDGATEAKQKREIRSAIASTLEQANQPVPAISAGSWLDMLENDDLNNYGNSTPLASAPFLDLGVYLQSVPSDSAERAFEGIFKAAQNFANAQQTVSDLLKQQVVTKAK